MFSCSKIISDAVYPIASNSETEFPVFGTCSHTIHFCVAATYVGSELPLTPSAVYDLWKKTTAVGEEPNKLRGTNGINLSLFVCACSPCLK